MKEAKIVRKENKGFKAFLIEKKGWAFIVGIFILFMLFFTAMPMVNIPFIGSVSAIFGLTPQEMGRMTLADVTAYAMGVKGNKIASIRDGKFSAYETVGGLSPFSVTARDRISQATADYLREYQANIGYTPGSEGPLSTVKKPGFENEYQGVGINPPGPSQTPVIDEERAADHSKGNPFYAGLLQTQDSGKTLKLTNKPLGGQGIDSKATAQSVFGQALENSTNKFVGGRLGVMGGFNAIANRINTRVGGVGQMGAFGAMGRSYFFSYNAKVAGYKVTAKNLAEAAFDGEEVPEEALIVPGEEKEQSLNTLEPPNTIINKANARAGMCKAAKESYQSFITQKRKSFKQSYDALVEIGSDYSKGVPGCCDKTLGFIGAKTAGKRNAWNTTLDALGDACEQLKQSEQSYTGKCGLNYNPSPKGNCAQLENLKLKGGCFPLLVWKCKNKVKFSNFGCSGKTDCRDKIRQVFSNVADSEVTGANANF